MTHDRATFDDTMATSVPGVWAAGDCPFWLSWSDNDRETGSVRNEFSTVWIHQARSVSVAAKRPGT
ncbi:hypothetical protein GCM10010464_29350 [Pseudonocardia yunnanensis]